jgi:nascent polypeptide-associated complex subunit alpha
MMKQMGIEQKDVSDVKEVIIRFADREWLIASPQVTMIKQPSGESFQVAGTKTERPLTTSATANRAAEPAEKRVIEIPMEDAVLVAGQAGVSVEAAKEALKETEGDLAAAILRLRRK